MDRPSALIAPASGTVSPRHMRMVVVLPAPLGPITPRHSPGAMSKDRSLTTVAVAIALAEVAGFEEDFAHGALRVRAVIVSQPPRSCSGVSAVDRIFVFVNPVPNVPNRLAVDAAIPAAQEATYRLCRAGGEHARRPDHPRHHPQVHREVQRRTWTRRPIPRIESYASFNDFFTRALREGARADGRLALRLPGGRGHQPVRPDRARPDLPGQGPQLFDARAGGRRPGAGAPVRPRPFRHAVSGAQGLPPHPHAVRGPPDAA